MPIDKKIKDAFNDPSLENEDWLLPPDSVFEKIEEDIYPEKKKRRFFYWWIGPFTGILLAILYFSFSYNFNASTNNEFINNKMVSDNHKQESQQANDSFSDAQKVEALQEVEANNVQTENLNNIENSDIKGVENAGFAIDKFNATKPEINQKQNDKSQQNDADKLEESLNEVGAENTSLNAISPKIESKKDENSISNTFISLATDRVEVNSKNVFDEAKTVAEIESGKLFERDFLEEKANDSESESTANLEIRIEQNTGDSDGNTEKILLKNNTIKHFHNNLSIAEKVGLERLNPLSILSISQEEEKHSIQPFEIGDLGSAINKNRKWFLSAGVSYNFWNFKLNDNYQTALTPADFTHSNGKGFAIFTGLERQLRSGFRIKSQVSFGKMKFESGHNSSIDYVLDLEGDDKTNEFDLTMASPLGFLNSNISVGRTEDATADTSSLIVDLNNSHVVTNVDFGLSILKDVYNYKSFRVSLEGGLGVNHLVSLKNDLYDFSVSKSGYYSESAAITGDQDELNKMRPYYLFGAAFVCSPRRKNELSLNYQFKEDFNAIYQSGDFSTLLNRHMVLVGYRIAFE